ncbi:MAG: hypothetical protein F4092_00355 [Rhodospirillaceae bacterium]|nr:hypothetical protein [Rhodospirillaceae bacterium]
MRQQEASIPARSLLSAFRDHPASVGETYPEHMGFAMRFGARLFCAGAAAFVHALIPALFESTASDTVKAMHAEIEGQGRTTG